jgi:stearoyl-CoA desaturase (delta-9 desaturase)
MGWMLYNIPADVDIPRYTKDISDDPVYQFLQNYFVPIKSFWA